MDAAAVLERLRSKGVTLEAQGDRLRYCPVDAVTAEDLMALRQHKAEVLALLQAAVPTMPTAPEGPATWRGWGIRKALRDKEKELALRLSDLATAYYRDDPWTREQAAILERHIAEIVRYLADGDTLALPRCCRRAELICLIASHGFSECVLTAPGCGFSWREGGA